MGRWALATVIFVAVGALMGCGASSTGAPTTGPSTSQSGSTGTTSPPGAGGGGTTALHTAVCAAVNDGKAGKWSEAQNEWLAAQNAVPDSEQLDLGIKLLDLNIETAALALETLTGSPAKASDLATYQTDLNALPSGTLSGC